MIAEEQAQVKITNKTNNEIAMDSSKTKSLLRKGVISMDYRNSEKSKKKNDIRYAEYYDMVEEFDKLYSDSSNGKAFKNLMGIISSEQNIKLAYRNIKSNKGSITPSIDGLTINEIKQLSEETIILTIKKKLNWYNPRKVKRVEIPKPNGSFRPLGIPSIWDRLVQQCILQVMEPICEARFYKNSFGFRPNRSAENAIAACHNHMQVGKTHFVVDVDIKGFFDNVDHSKLLKQIWTLGIRDKQLICIIKKMLKAPIVMPDGEIVMSEKGTPQGGILSPLLANIVLNEFDWWIASQWENRNLETVKPQYLKCGNRMRGNEYRAMRNTKLKEMYLVRYADDFKIFCSNPVAAGKIYHAVKMWLKERLRLDISEEKSKIVNIRKNYSNFLGFKLKVVRKGRRYAVKSHMSDKAFKATLQQLKSHVKAIQSPADIHKERLEILKYNALVIGKHDYYEIATHISKDVSKLGLSVHLLLYNRMVRGKRDLRLRRSGSKLKNKAYEKYYFSRQIRFMHDVPILPIGYCKTKIPMNKPAIVNKYTPDGRAAIHNLQKSVSKEDLYQLMASPIPSRSIEYNDNRISLYVAQYGKCAITGKYVKYNELHCHHKIPISLGGSDEYKNLLIISQDIHILLHATNLETIRNYILRCNITAEQSNKINMYRKLICIPEITMS